MDNLRKRIVKVLPDEEHGILDKLLLGSVVEEMGSPGIVVDPELASRTACKCFPLDSTKKKLCFSPGIIGALKYPEQVETYCPTIIEEESPALKERVAKFTEAVEEAHKKVENIPKGQRLEPWLKAVSKSLKVRGLEI